MKKNKCGAIFLGIFVLCGFVNAAEPLEEDPLLPRYRRMDLTLGSSEKSLLRSVEAGAFRLFGQMLKEQSEGNVLPKNQFLFYIRRFVCCRTGISIYNRDCFASSRVTVSFDKIIVVKDSGTIELKSRLAEKIYKVIQEQLEKLAITPSEGLIVQRPNPQWGGCVIS